MACDPHQVKSQVQRELDRCLLFKGVLASEILSKWSFFQQAKLANAINQLKYVVHFVCFVPLPPPWWFGSIALCPLGSSLLAPPGPRLQMKAKVRHGSRALVGSSCLTSDWSWNLSGPLLGSL